MTTAAVSRAYRLSPTASSAFHIAYVAWQEAMIEGSYSDHAHGLKFVSDITMSASGPWLFIDAQSLIRPLMREAYLRVLVEELDRAGVKRATVTVRYEDEF